MNYTNAYPVFYKLTSNECELYDFIGVNISYWEDEKGQRHPVDVDEVNRLVRERTKEIVNSKNTNVLFWTVDKLTEKQEKLTTRPLDRSYLMGIECNGYKYLFAMDTENCIFINYSRADKNVNKKVGNRWEYMPEESDSFGIYHKSSGYYIYNTYQAFCSYSKKIHDSKPKFIYNREFFDIISVLIDAIEFQENQSSYTCYVDIGQRGFQVKILAIGWTLIVYEMNECIPTVILQ